MNVRKLGLITELALAATRGRVVDREDYVVVETPDDPGYYLGNALVWPAPPQVGEIAYRMRRFGDELGTNPAIKHVTLRWDGTTGDAGSADLVAAGFAIERGQVMTAEAVVAPPIALGVRPLVAAELELVVDLAWALGDRHDESYRAFLERRAAWHRRLVDSKLATMWGAFDGAALIASLGLVQLGTVARYQDVQTATAYRGRGIASALLAASSRAARAAGSAMVVIVAEAESHAARLYERLGFAPAEVIASAIRRAGAAGAAGAAGVAGVG